MRLAKPREMQGQSEDGHGKPIHVMCMVGQVHSMLKMTVQNTPPLEREQSSTSSKERMFILFAREEPEYTKTHYRGSPYLTAACCEAEQKATKVETAPREN